MKILMAHNTHLIPGGEDETFVQEKKLLQQHGHHVIPFICENKIIEHIPLWKVSLRTLWSFEDYWKVRYIIRDKKPNILHVQNTFPLISPSIFYAAHHENVPTVMSLHNYRLYCLNAYFFRNGRACEDCITQAIPLSGIRYRCYRQSLAGSLVTAGLITLHRILRTYQKQVDAFIALTEFSQQKFAENGIPIEKIHIKPNFTGLPNIHNGNREAFFLYVGRLSPEKGISVLLDAWKHIDKNIQLKIAGSGLLENLVQESVNKHSNIEYLGHQPIQEIYKLLSRTQALIFPSLWYEGMPRTIVEAFSQGTPVIASKLGAMATMIQNEVTGLHFEPGNSLSLVNSIHWFLNHSHCIESMRQSTLQDFQEKYTATQNYNQLMEIYDAAHITFQQVIN